MAQRNVQFVENEYYHIYNRGCNRELIFRSDENYRFLLRKMRKYFIGGELSVIAYCLMPNHYHFLLRQNSSISAGRIIQSIFNGYTKAFNQMWKRSGTLFEGPFKVKWIKEFGYLIHLSRYIHRNPLDAGLVDTIETWQYSNYPEWIGLRDDVLVDRAFVKEHYSSPNEYKAFALEYDPLKKIKKDLEKYSFD
ncbi:MAG TPA: transposase [Bacteroidota bacterium]|nr:transposase [Bacteroidota bacterium]